KGATMASRSDNLAVRRWVGLPLAAGIITAIVALEMALVVFDNVTDFNTNREFVEHVLAMDTTFRANGLMWRSIAHGGTQTAAYIGVILWEAASAFVLVAATVLWVRAMRRDSFARFREAATIGFVMLLVLFGGAFIAVGGEWFAMWQSGQWNG